jgi:hypothetical protein
MTMTMTMAIERLSGLPVATLLSVGHQTVPGQRTPSVSHAAVSVSQTRKVRCFTVTAISYFVFNALLVE